MPSFIEPHFPKLVDRAPAGDNRIQEVKSDGQQVRVARKMAESFCYGSPLPIFPAWTAFGKNVEAISGQVQRISVSIEALK
jgi:hypothetical protein